MLQLVSRVDHLGDKDWYELNELVEVHGRASLPLSNGTVVILIEVFVRGVNLVLLASCRDDVVEEIAAIRETWLGELNCETVCVLTVVLVIITGGWKGYLSRNKMSK